MSDAFPDAGCIPLIGVEPSHPMVSLGRGALVNYQDRRVDELVEAQVHATPNRTAIVCAGAPLSYDDLWATAGQVADVLATVGIGCGVPVGVSLTRSPLLIPALLGIWRAGGGYVALDGQMPTLRRERIVDEVRGHGMRWMLTDSAASAARLDVEPIHSIALRGWPEPLLLCALPSDGTGFGAIGRLGNLAYVMYTSGSTGQPKGTVVTHENLCAFLVAIEAALGGDPDEVTIATTPLTFDISVLELIWPLSTGRRVILLDSIPDMEPGLLSAVLRCPGPKLLQVTPSTSALVVFPERTDELRVLVGGEALPQPTAARILRHSTSVVNMYGPTETTVWVTYHHVSGPDERAVVPLGRPLPNCGLVVVGTDHRLTQVGEEGELYVYGPQVASGYLRTGGDAARNFIADEHGHRAYRTGDRVRWSADGTLEFLGRVDNQVKIAGNRVELGEIEAALREYSGVDDAVVILDRRSSPPRVRAFIQPKTAPGQTRAGEYALVADWVRVFDEQHLALQGRDENGLVPGVWRSSADGTAIPGEEMHEWLNAAAELVLDGGARRVLDIGCGTGALLAALGDRIDRYVGLEPSSHAVRHLEATFSDRANTARFLHASAHELRLAEIDSLIQGMTGWDGEFGRPDCIVLNSVVQYFPSLDYLSEVLDLAFALLAKGGRLLVTDVRNRALLPKLETWRRRRRNDDGAGPPPADNELCIEPRYFEVWASRQLPLPTVWAIPKFLRHDNELAAYRFDVEIGKVASPDPRPYVTMPYESVPGGLTGLTGLFPRTAVVVTGIPDGRLPGRDESGPTDPVELRRVLADRPDCRVAIDPFDAQRGSLMVVYPADGRPHWGHIAAAATAPTELGTAPRVDASAHALSGIGEHLDQRLPPHMLPADIWLVPRLPLTSSGKIDRTRLAAEPPDGIAVSLPWADGRQRSSDEPSDETRGDGFLERLVGLANQLSTVHLGPDDDLVRAGITSLDAVRLAGLAWQRFGWSVTGGQILRMRTLRLISRHCTADPGLPGAGERGSPADADVSLAQRSMLAISYLDPATAKTNIAMHWQLEGAVDESRLRRALAAVVHNHPILRTLYPPSDGPVVLDIPDGPDLVVAEPDENGLSILDALARAPFDLDHEPLARWLLVHAKVGSTSLHAVLHHAAVDDNALATLHLALVDAYAGGSRSGAPTASYGEVCAAERRLLAQRSRSDRAHWRSRHGSFEGTAGFAQRETPPASGVHRSSRIMSGGDTLLQAAARSVDVTAYSLFLAAVCATVANGLGSDSILVGVPVSSREAVGGDGLLGCFANLVPLVVWDHPADAIRTIRESHEAVLEGLDHGLLPYAEIARLADLPRQPFWGNAPWLVCQLAHAPEPAEAQGVTFVPRLGKPVTAFYPVTVRGETARGDLTLHVDYAPGVMDEGAADDFVQGVLDTLVRYSRLETR